MLGFIMKKQSMIGRNKSIEKVVNQIVEKMKNEITGPH